MRDKRGGIRNEDDIGTNIHSYALTPSFLHSSMPVFAFTHSILSYLTFYSISNLLPYPYLLLYPYLLPYTTLHYPTLSHLSNITLTLLYPVPPLPPTLPHPPCAGQGRNPSNHHPYLLTHPPTPLPPTLSYLTPVLQVKDGTQAITTALNQLVDYNKAKSTATAGKGGSGGGEYSGGNSGMTFKATSTFTGGYQRVKLIVTTRPLHTYHTTYTSLTLIP